MPETAISDENASVYCNGIHEDFRDTFIRFIVALFRFVRAYGEGNGPSAIASGNFTRLNTVYVYVEI